MLDLQLILIIYLWQQDLNPQPRGCCWEIVTQLGAYLQLLLVIMD